MRTAAVILLLLIFLPIIVSAGEEYEIFTEIFGNPLDCSLNDFMDVDSDGMLWVCSGGGVYRHNGTSWEDFTEISGGASTVSASPDGDVWFADDGKLSSFDGTEWTYYAEAQELSGNIIDISAGTNGLLWIAGYYSGYYYLAKFDGLEMEFYLEGFLQNYISRITATTDGGVWIVYNNFFDSSQCFRDDCPVGTSYFDGTAFYHYTGSNGLPYSIFYGPDVQWIIQDKSGYIYVTCSNTLYLHFDDTWMPIFEDIDQAIPVSVVKGELWYGYFGQPESLLGCHKDDKWTYFYVDDIDNQLRQELASNDSLHSSDMAVTPDGTVWVGFREGIVKIDTSKLLVWEDGIPVAAEQPSTFSCKIAAYPNPFNPATTLTYTVSQPTHVTLSVYSSTGRKVASLVDRYVSMGEHSAIFDAGGLPSGVYLYRFEAGGTVKSGAMTLVK